MRCFGIAALHRSAPWTALKEVALKRRERLLVRAMRRWAAHGRPRRRRRALLAAMLGLGGVEGRHDFISRIDSARSCSAIKHRVPGTAIYRVAGRAVLCDMSTDGGGWTLVASGRAPPSDYGGRWYDDLMTLRPEEQMPPHLWYASSLEGSTNDIRFSCTTNRCESETGCTYKVDLAFYDNPWYKWIARTDVNEYQRR